MPVAIVKNALANAEHQQIGAGVGLAQILGNGSEEAPLHCGSYTMEAGAETTIDYVCSIFCLTLEGDFTMEDTAKPGEIRKVNKGDICHVSKGSTVKWGSESGGKAFYTIQLPSGVDPSLYFDAGK